MKNAAVGFYLEMERATGGGEFRELKIPPVFWFLYLFTGFALACMGGAAYAVLGDLASKGSTLDRALVWLILAFLPLYLLLGLKLAGVRKYVQYQGETLRVGFSIFGRLTLFERTLPRSEIRAVELVNRKPAPNLAPKHHDDSQYFIRGHWRLVAVARSGRTITLDKHTEKGALAALHADVLKWLSN